MAESEGQQQQYQNKRKPLQLIGFENGILKWNTSTWDFLQSQIPEENEIAVIGIVGTPRAGKSLLANYIVEYLENHQNPGHKWLKTWEHENDTKYIDEISSGGSSFERFPVAIKGPVVCYSSNFAPGIYVWLVDSTIERGENPPLSVLVLDVHWSLKMNELRPNVYGPLIDFVFMASSLVLFVDTLAHWKSKENLELWIPSKSSVFKLGEKFFQTCHYILRGWNEPEKYKFGSKYGQHFLNDNKKKDSLFYEHAQELTLILQDQFQDFSFHLLPESNAEYSRILKGKSPQFIKYFTSFVKTDLDVEELNPVIGRWGANKGKNLTVKTLELFLKFPMNIVHIPSYETSVDTPLPVDEDDIDIKDESQSMEIDDDYGKIPETKNSELEEEEEKEGFVIVSMPENSEGKAEIKEPVRNETDITTSMKSETGIYPNLSKSNLDENYPQTNPKNPQNNVSQQQIIFTPPYPYPSLFSSSQSSTVPSSQPQQSSASSSTSTFSSISFPPSSAPSSSISSPSFPKSSTESSLSLQPPQQEQQEPTKSETPMEVDPPQKSESKPEVKKEAKVTSSQTCPALDQTKTEEEPLVLDMIEKLFDPALEILNSSQYFCYPEVTKEIEKVKEELKSTFPIYFSPANKSTKVVTKFGKLSNAIKKKNLENKQRKEEIENKINTTFNSMWKSEFQTLKSVAEKASPEPIEWRPDCEKLYNHHFDFLIQSIASSTSPGYDQEFKRECHEMSWKKTESVCTATKFTCSFINEYSQNMALELEKNVCFPVESDFTQLHENTIIVIYNKINSQTVVKKFETVWTRLHDLTKAAVLEYEKKFREENHQIRREEAEIAEKAKDFALTKYNNFMNNETSQGSGIFTRSEILNFHNEAYQKIKTCFTGIPHFKYTFSWEKSWQKLDRELKELEKSYLDKNQQKIERTTLQRKNSMAAAENEYRKLMNNSISRTSHGKSIEQKELEDFHAEGVKKALELYGKKMDGIQGDVKKYKETLISKFMDIRKQLMSENDEKVAREIREKEEREVKQTEQEEQLKKERESQIQQQKSQPQDISKIIIKNSPCNSNQINSNASSSSTTEFQGGIAIHFSKEGVNIGSRQKSGFTIIAKNLPPTIAFTKTHILIGEEAAAISTSGYDPNIFKLNLFDILQAEKSDTQRVMINGKSEWLQTEEILAIFFYKLVNMIQNVHPDFNPSRSFVEFVISPFFRLPVKQKLKIALDLAGFDSTHTHILQSTMAMALTYFHKNPHKLQQSERPHFIVVIHSSPGILDIGLFSGSSSNIKCVLQTGLPYSQKAGHVRNLVEKFNRLWKSEEAEREKILEGLVKTMIKENKLKVEDLQSVVSCVHSHDEEQQKAVKRVFQKEIWTLHETEGILQGAAALALYKAGLPTFSCVKIQEIHPYYLEAVFSEKFGYDEVKHEVFRRHEPYPDVNEAHLYKVPKAVSYSNNNFDLMESSEKVQWNVGSYSVDKTKKIGTIVGCELQFEISPEGLVNVSWPPKSTNHNNLPLSSKTIWLNCEEQENANRKLQKIFSTFTGSHSSSLTTVASSTSSTRSSSLTTSTSVSTSAIVQTSASKGSSTANVQATVVDSGESEELRQSKNELKLYVQEVKSQLEKSQGTSKLVRDQIEELIPEIDKVLNGSETVEAALLRSYGEKLKIRAKRIK